MLILKGDRGYCYIPYDYMTNTEYCFDAWTVRKLNTSDFSQDNWSFDDNNSYTDNSRSDNFYKVDSDGAYIQVIAENNNLTSADFNVFQNPSYSDYQSTPYENYQENDAASNANTGQPDYGYNISNVNLSNNPFFDNNTTFDQQNYDNNYYDAN